MAALSVLGRRNGCSLVDRAFKFSNFLDTKDGMQGVYIFLMFLYVSVYVDNEASEILLPFSHPLGHGILYAQLAKRVLIQVL